METLNQLFLQLNHKVTLSCLKVYFNSPAFTGKMLADELITDYAHQQDLAGKPFVLRDFMDRFNSEGMIPVPLMESEMVPGSTRVSGPQKP